MRTKVKQILSLAVLAALTVAGMSLAAGGGGGSKNESQDAAGTPATLEVNGDQKGVRERGRFELRGDFADADVRAVLDDIRAAVAKQAPEIAGPVIDKAENDKKITSAQADELRKAAEDIAAGKLPEPRALPRDRDVREVINAAMAAVAAKAPGIAEPIIDKAVSDKKITEAQGNRIRDMVKRGGPGPFLGPRGGPCPGPGGRHFGGPPGIADEDVRTVLEDVHSAVAKQAPGIAGPVIDKAENDGKITAAQADDLRDAAGGLLAGKPRGGPPRLLNLRDADVREVLKDTFDAIAKKRAEIAKPIIDKAVSEKKITEAQAERLRAMMNRDKGGFHVRSAFPRHRPPHFEGPGGPSVDPAAPTIPGSPA